MVQNVKHLGGQRYRETFGRSFEDFETCLDVDLPPSGAGPGLGAVLGLTSFAERRAAALAAQLP